MPRGNSYAQRTEGYTFAKDFGARTPRFERSRAACINGTDAVAGGHACNHMHLRSGTCAPDKRARGAARRLFSGLCGTPAPCESSIEQKKEKIRTCLIFSRSRTAPKLYRSAASYDCLLDEEYDNGANDCDEHAPDVEPVHTNGAKRVEDETTDNGADNAKHDVKDKAVTTSIDELASDKTRDET
jgi:hypothetical protein